MRSLQTKQSGIHTAFEIKKFNASIKIINLAVKKSATLIFYVTECNAFDEYLKSHQKTYKLTITQP